MPLSVNQWLQNGIHSINYMIRVKFHFFFSNCMRTFYWADEDLAVIINSNVPMQLSMVEVMVLVQWASALSITCQNVFTWTLYSSFARKELNSCDKCNLWSYNCSKWCPIRWCLWIRKPLRWWLWNKHRGVNWAQLCSMMASHVAAGAIR